MIYYVITLALLMTYVTSVTSCDDVNCGYPDMDFDNGYREGDDFTCPNIVKLFCNRGYYMFSGSSQRRCQIDGSWSGSKPVCSIVKCPALPDLDNGNYLFTTNTREYGVEATLKCNGGYMVVGGDATRRCTAEKGDRDGHWSGNAISCDRLQCTRPEISNGVVKGSVYVDESISFECNEGYHIPSGIISTIYCMEFRGKPVWDAAIPTCRIVDPCLPGSIKNGHIAGVKKAEYAKDESITYVCDVNYYMSGDTTYTCNAPDWDKLITAKCCCTAPEVENAYLSTNTCTSVGYECEESYTMVGSCKYNCINGEYQGDCACTKCGPPPEVDNAHYVTTTSTKVEYECDKLHEQSGDCKFECVDDKWVSDEACKCQSEHWKGIVGGVAVGIIGVLVIAAVGCCCFNGMFCFKKKSGKAGYNGVRT